MLEATAVHERVAWDMDFKRSMFELCFRSE
jgi:hypothetical protein